MLRSLSLKGTIPTATAAVVFSALLIVATPVAATESGSESATVTSRLLAVGKKHSVRTMRAALRPRQVNCCDGWSGRQFVLMLGVGY